MQYILDLIIILYFDFAIKNCEVFLTLWHLTSGIPIMQCNVQNTELKVTFI
jgi:hypothetical protein